jgi:integrase/recombinase XerC
VPTFSELVDQWLQVHKSVHSYKHWKDVEMVSRNWILPSIGSKPVNRVTNGDVSGLRSKMLGVGRSPVTINDVLKIIKLLGRYAIKLGSIRELPFQVEFLKVQKKPRPTVPAVRIQEFLEAVDQSARNPHVRVMIRVMVGLGLREAEVRGMRWEWIDTHQQCYIVGKSKGRETRQLPVPDWTWEAIQKLPNMVSEWVFPARDGNPHRPQFCTKALKRVCDKLGLGNVTQHRLRATFASLHAEAGTPITEIKEMLGHKDLATTMIYVETSLAAKRKAQDSLSKKLGLV